MSAPQVISTHKRFCIKQSTDSRFYWVGIEEWSWYASDLTFDDDAIAIANATGFMAALELVGAI